MINNDLADLLGHLIDNEEEAPDVKSEDELTEDEDDEEAEFRYD